ncbi:MAG: hypothetical protein IT463_10540 [Planctomycetes bacterium]|nr:hypothetical protein [Planctomycetota bacterium]
MAVRIAAYARIAPEGVLGRGARPFAHSWREFSPDAPDAFGLPPLKARYFLDEPFPKYGRMDPLCKVAVAAALLAFRAGDGLPGLNRDEMAQAGGTMLGCLEVDAQFEATRLAGQPSPGLFVYTLPSMFQGETAILLRLRGQASLNAAGALSGLAALSSGARLVQQGRAASVLVVAADAAGPAAARAMGAAPFSGACAWVLAPQGELGGIAGVSYEPTPGAVALPRGPWPFALSFLHGLEEHMAAPSRATLCAEADGQAVCLQVEP